MNVNYYIFYYFHLTCIKCVKSTAYVKKNIILERIELRLNIHTSLYNFIYHANVSAHNVL
jgi:hypothetical protein